MLDIYLQDEDVQRLSAEGSRGGDRGSSTERQGSQYMCNTNLSRRIISPRTTTIWASI